MKFSIKTALFATAFCAILICVARYLPGFAFFVLSITPLSWFVANRKPLGSSLRIAPRFLCLAIVTFFAYVGSFGPFNTLLAPTEWDRDHPWTQAVEAVGLVIYAPLVCKPLCSLLAKLKLGQLFTDYAAEWHSYGLYILGKPSKYTVPSG